MDLLLQHKTVLVTGASKGLGKAIALQYAFEGANVIISSRNETTLKETTAEIRAETKNEHIRYVVCDMANAGHIESLVNDVVKQFAGIDVLINNAGGPPAGAFMELTDEMWYEAFEQNLLSVVRASRLAIPHMKKNGKGRIVNITSSSIKQSLDQLMLSNALRPGVMGLTKTLAREVAKDNILVNTVGPGTIATERIEQLTDMRAKATGTDPNKLEREMIANIPLGRLGTPDEFAKAVVFLGSFANTYITGQSLIVDGGSVRAL